MKKFACFSFLAVLFFFISVAVSTHTAAQEYGPPGKVTEWVMQPCFTSADIGWGLGIVPWIKAVEEATQGTVKINLQPSGAITSGGEAFIATAAGMLDATSCWATVYGGDLPEGMLAYGLAMGADNWRDAWAAMFGDPKYQIGKLVQEAAHEKNMHWAGWTSQGPNAAFTKFPVHRLEDFSGRKMRAGGPQAFFLQAAGGAPVSMGMGDIYTAIRLGTIEGTFWNTSGIINMAFHEVTNYAIMPGWCPAQHQEIFINLDRWKALNQWQRDRISEIFAPVYFETSRLHYAKVESALKEFVEAGGEVLRLSDQEVKRIRDLSIKEVWPRIAEMSARNAKGVELWKEFLRDIGKF